MEQDILANFDAVILIKNMNIWTWNNMIKSLGSFNFFQSSSFYL